MSTIDLEEVYVEKTHTIIFIWTGEIFIGHVPSAIDTRAIDFLKWARRCPSAPIWKQLNLRNPACWILAETIQMIT
ncbi:hypothetical protein PPUJ13061_55750 [Pseudomonas putida]|nr:hypothetical protein PPUJ13061_55750 [Pseudomonas putida]